MIYYDSLGAAGYPISGGVDMATSFQEHLDRGSAGGVDYAVRTGSPIPAPTRGRVRNWTGNSAGNAVDFFHIDDNGVETGFFDQFMHLKDGGFVAEGVYNPGETIGYSGNTGTSTGPHIHWNARLNGRVVRQWEYFTSTPAHHEKGASKSCIARAGRMWFILKKPELQRLLNVVANTLFFEPMRKHN